MILIAMPAYNEAKYIESIITKSKQYGEVLVVDDGSLDNTGELAKRAGAMVVNHPKNLGYGSAIITILEEAKRRDFDVLVLIDADTQHDPQDIPNLVQPIIDGYDLAIGSRNGSDIPKYRHIGGRVLSIFTYILSGVNVYDSQSGFRAFSKKAVNRLQPKEKGMAVSSEVVYEASKNNLKIIEVPISIRYTKDGSTMNPVIQGFYTLFKIWGMIVKKVML